MPSKPPQIHRPIKIVVFDTRKQPESSEMHQVDVAIAIDGDMVRVVKNRLGEVNIDSASVGMAVKKAISALNEASGWDADRISGGPQRVTYVGTMPGMPTPPDDLDDAPEEERKGMERWIKRDEDVWP